MSGSLLTLKNFNKDEIEADRNRIEVQSRLGPSIVFVQK